MSRRIFTPGVSTGHDQHRRALVLVRVGVGDRHHDQEVRHRRVGGEPLAAVDDPLVAVEHRGRLQQRRVRAGGVRLGHRERRLAGRRPAAGAATAASGPPCRPARGSPSCPSRAPRCRTPPARTGVVPRISCIRPSLTWPKPWPPSSGSQVRRPQAALAHLLLQRRDRAPEARRRRARRRSSRSARSPRARTSRIQSSCCLELGLGREIPGHAFPPSESGPRTESRVAVDGPRCWSPPASAVAAGAALQSATGFGFAAARGAAGVRRARPARGDRPAAAARDGDRRADARHGGPPAAADGAALRDRARLGGARARSPAWRCCARSTPSTLQVAVSVGVAATLLVRRRAPARAQRAGAALGRARDGPQRRRARDLDEHERPAAAALPARPRRRARARARHAHGLPARAERDRRRRARRRPAPRARSRAAWLVAVFVPLVLLAHLAGRPLFARLAEQRRLRAGAHRDARRRGGRRASSTARRSEAL